MKLGEEGEGLATNSFWEDAVEVELPQNSRGQWVLFRRSAADGVAASNPVRRTRVGIVEGVPRVSAVGEEQKEWMRIFFLVTNFADLIFEFADSP